MFLENHNITNFDWKLKVFENLTNVQWCEFNGFKRIVHLNMNVRKMQVSLILHQVWRNVSRQWMLCSEWVPSEWESMDALQWMGAVRMRVWWKHHSTPVHQLTSGEDKRWNKSSIKTFLSQIWIHNNSSSSEKVHLLSFLSHQNPATYLFRAVLSCKRCLILCRFLSWFRPEHFTAESVIKDYELVF